MQKIIKFAYIIKLHFTMGPKKADGEGKQKQYQTFKASEQFAKIEQLNKDITVNMVNIHGKQDPFISETSEDFHINGRHQILWDRLYELAVLMKIKPPFKKIEHEWMRSTYFGQKIKVNKDDKIYTVDGIVCEFEPEYSDAQRNIKQALHKKITNIIKDMDETFDIENFNKSRAQVKKGFQQMFNQLKNYVKKAFKIIYEQKFMEVLKPFSDLLQINMKLVLYELKYDTEDAKFVNDFKKKAIVQRYCECLQKVLYILMTYPRKEDKQKGKEDEQKPPIFHKIIPANIFKKLDYTNLTPIQSFYLTPFSQAFSDMKKGLCALMTTGINFWKVPIRKNIKFVEHFKILVDWQIVTQRHFGNQLLRDQINFAANTLARIYEASQPSKQYMLSKDLNSMEISIPRLMAFKTIQHMRDYRDKEEKIRLKEEERRKLLGMTSTESKPDKQDEKSMTMSPSKTKNQFTKGNETNADMTKSKATVKGLTLLRKDSLEEQKQKLGRYWIWQNYCDDEFRNKYIEPAVQKLLHINKAVQQDIQDAIIREGMLPRKDRHDEQRINAADTLKNMKTYDNALKSKNMQRPPELWNFPQIIEEEHKFRSIAEPKKCYIDGRVQDLDEYLAKIGNYLMTYNKRDWNELIRRVIDFYAKKPNPDPTFQV